MNQPSQDQIEHWFAFADKWIPRKKEKIASGEGKQDTHVSLAGVYASDARAKLLNGDPLVDVRSEFATAARHVMKSFTMAYDESDLDYQGEAADLSAVIETIAIRGFNYALMAGDFDLAEELAGWFRDPPDGKLMSVEVNRYAHALKHTLRGESDPARKLLKAQLDEYLAKPSKRRDYRMNFFTLSEALLGILDKDEMRFNDGLKKQLEFYQSIAQGEVKNTDEEFICDYAVALANLGIHHGLKVTVEHDTLPKGLLFQS